MSAVLQEIISLLVSGITQLASGLGSGIKALVTDIFLDTSGSTTQLSTFGGIIVVFSGVSLAIGLSRWVINFLTSWGN